MLHQALGLQKQLYTHLATTTTKIVFFAFILHTNSEVADGKGIDGTCATTASDQQLARGVDLESPTADKTKQDEPFWDQTPTNQE